jgi:hypothetical protein
MKKEIEGLRWVPRWVSHLGCVKGCLDYLGVGVSASLMRVRACLLRRAAYVREGKRGVLRGGGRRVRHLLRSPSSTTSRRASTLFAAIHCFSK